MYKAKKNTVEWEDKQDKSQMNEEAVILPAQQNKFGEFSKFSIFNLDHGKTSNGLFNSYLSNPTSNNRGNTNLLPSDGDTIKRLKNNLRNPQDIHSRLW